MSTERYEIKKKLGEGGAGAVYIAQDTRLNREVAIKRVATEQGGWSQDTVDAMLKEAQVLSSITHPNIVTIFDADVDDDGPYVVMELLKGRNIDDLIAENTLTGADFEDFATQCLEALTAAHSHDIIHRDIKPNNIVLKWLPSGKFQAKLLDFGMAKLTKEPTKQTVDQSDSVFGSIYFMAPEQFERIELDARTDLYALGSVFYYTLTGYYPFTGDSPAEVMASHLTHRVEPLSESRPDLPAWVSDWVMWLINREMSHRPENAQAALDLFQANLAKTPLKTASASATEFNQESEPQYFGQADHDGGGIKINKAATKPLRTAKVYAPILLGASGSLEQQAVEQVQVATPTSTIAQPVPTKQVALNTAPLATATVATPKATVATASTTAPVTTAPAATTQATISKTAAPANTNAVGSGKGPTKLQRVAPKDPSGNPVGLPSTASTEQPKSNASLYSLLAVVVVALISVGILLNIKLKANKEVAKINALLAPARAGDKDIPTTKSEVKVLLAQLYTSSGQFENDLIYRRLSEAKSTDGNDIDEQVANFATQPGDDIIKEVRAALFRVLGRRKGEGSLDVLNAFIETTSNDELATTAIRATKSIVKPRDLNLLLDIMLTTDHSDKRMACEEVVSAVIQKTEERSSITRVLKKALGNAQTELSRAVIIRLIGELGGDEAKGIITAELKSNDPKKVIPALGGLRDWPDDSMTEFALEYWTGCSDEIIRRKSFEAAMRMMQKYHLQKPESQVHWQFMLDNVSEAREKNDLINALVSTKSNFAVPMIKTFANDSNTSVIRLSEKALRAIKRRQNQ